jgi:hypothetical protein
MEVYAPRKYVGNIFFTKQSITYILQYTEFKANKDSVTNNIICHLQMARSVALPSMT